MHFSDKIEIKDGTQSGFQVNVTFDHMKEPSFKLLAIKTAQRYFRPVVRHYANHQYIADKETQHMLPDGAIAQCKILLGEYFQTLSNQLIKE